MFNHFQTKDLTLLRYFIGIKVVQSNSGNVISQKKYVLVILEETGMSNCKPIDSSMDPNSKLLPRERSLLQTLKDTKDKLINLITSPSHDLTSPSLLVLLVNFYSLRVIVIRMQFLEFWDISRVHQTKVCYMKTGVIHKLSDIMILIGHAFHLIDAPLRVFVFLLEET